jgi:hypothetical protein
MEEKLAELERANFDLKMRVYYLNNKLAEAEQGGYLEESAEKVVNLLQQRDSTADKLRIENAAANRKISDLETELNLLKAKLESTIQSRDVTLGKARESSILQMEENLKRERQAALAVAQHDSAVIIQLESEIKRLNGRHDSDLSLLAEASEKCAKLLQTIGEKDRDIERISETAKVSKDQCDILHEKIKNQELVINDLNHRLQNALERRNIQYVSLRQTPSSAFSGIPVHQQYTQYSMPYSSDHVYDYSAVETVNGSFSSPKPAPRLGAPFMAADIRKDVDYQQQGQSIHNLEFSQRLDSSQNNFPSFRTADQTNGGSYGHLRSLRDKYASNPISTSGLHAPSIPGPAADTVRAEILSARSENESLKLQLETERSAMKNLESILNNVRAAADEITLLEAEEIARLEAELDKMVQEKSRLSESLKKAQESVEVLRVQNLTLENKLKTTQHELHQSEMRAPALQSASNKPKTRSRSSASRHEDFDSGNYDGAAKAFGGHGSKYVPDRSYLLQRDEEVKDRDRVIDMYRLIGDLVGMVFCIMKVLYFIVV